jgi:hypothetical protein
MKAKKSATNDLGEKFKGISIYIRSGVKFSEVANEIGFEEINMIKFSSRTCEESHFGIVYES